MVFSSIIFIFGFLPIFLAIYYILPGNGVWRNLFTLIASYVFYAWGALNFLWFLVALTVVNYFLGLMVRGRNGKVVLIFGVMVEIFALGYFKYANFFVEQMNAVGSNFGFSPWVWEKIALPLGISFFTFHGISYLVDVYRGQTPVEKNFVNFALYVAFFPQLIAGPIIRYQEIASQIKKREHSFEKFFDGVVMFCFGLAMKVLLANQIAAMSGNLGDAASAGTNVESGALWLMAICFSMQIYFDFAGYSKMAIGLGKMMGFEMPKNFDRPYLSVTVSEFWRRWHISLMNFFREYVYFPLGGSRVILWKICRNILFIFLLSGIWHGANWTFIVWGLYFGIWLVVERIFEEKYLSKIPILIRRVMTFLIVVFGWVIFFAESLGVAWVNFIGMMKFNFSDLSVSAMVTNKEWFFFVAAILIAFFPEISFTKKLESIVSLKGGLALVLLIYSVMQLAVGSFNPFIYFRF